LAKQQQGVSPEDLTSYQEQCAAVSRDWQQLAQLIENYSAPEADRKRLEDDFVGLRCTLSCDYPILTYWRKGGYGLSAGIQRMMDGAPTLETLSDPSGTARGKVQEQWQTVWDALEKINGALKSAQQAIQNGKEPQLPRELLRHDIHVPFPIKRVLKFLGLAALVLVSLATLYFMRNFLGFWAPGAGDGLAVTDEMTNEQKIEVALITMSRAFQQNDVDLFMTVVADDFRDEEGNGKRALRVALQAYRETGEFGSVSMDWSRMRITERDGILQASPVYIVAPDGRLTIFLGFRDYRGKLLIATGSAA